MFHLFSIHSSQSTFTPVYNGNVCESDHVANKVLFQELLILARKLMMQKKGKAVK